MTNIQSSVRTLFVYVLVLPVAIILGYLLATSGAGSYFDMSSWAMIGFILAFICLPLILRWHHPVLLMTWNLSATVFFVPGSPPFWFVMTALSLTISAAQRAMDRDMRFIQAPSIVWPLLFLGAVVFIVGYSTGGFGSRIFGSEQYGGKRYWFIFASIAAYFAFVAQPIPRDKALLYLGFFFLGSVLDLMTVIIPWLPPEFYWLALIFPVSVNDLGSMAFLNRIDGGIPRFHGLTAGCGGMFFYMLARYGIRDMLVGSKIWRFVLLGIVLVVSMFGGFRSSLILFGLTFALLFYFEKLVRTRYTAIFLGVMVLGLVALVPIANKLPLSIQRTLTILPLDLNPVARYEAEGSSQWRLDMWALLIPEIPKYLWKPKGLGIDSIDLELTTDLASRGLVHSQEAALLAGDYHNGPLTLIIPFGIWGCIAFLWFIAASIRALWRNHLYGPESLRKINTFLLAYFIARTLHFVFIFGGFFSDISAFVGIIGFSLCLNQGICQAPVKKTEEQFEPETIGAAPLLARSVS